MGRVRLRTSSRISRNSSRSSSISSKFSTGVCCGRESWLTLLCLTPSYCKWSCASNWTLDLSSQTVSLLLDVQPTKKECQYNITYPPLIHQSSFVVSFVGHTWKTWMWTHLNWAVSYCESESQAWTFSVVVGQVMGQYLSLFLPKSIYLSQRGVFLNVFSELMWYHLWFLGTSGKNCTWHFV